METRQTVQTRRRPRRPQDNPIVSTRFGLKDCSQPTSYIPSDHGSPSSLTLLQGGRLPIKPDDTPLHLRNLENRWKTRRRKVLEDVSNQASTCASTSSDLPISYLAFGGKRRLDKTQTIFQNDTKSSKPNILLEDTHNAKTQVAQIWNQTVSCFPVLRGLPLTPPDSPSIKGQQLQKAPYSAFQDQAMVLPSHQDLRAAAVPKIVPKMSSTFKSSYAPVKAYPLPPTPHPVPLGAGGGNTIHVSPSPSLEMILNLARSKQIRIQKGGRQMVFLNSKPIKGWIMQKRLNVLEKEGWALEDVKDWELIENYVQRFKRQTPQAKIYHALGNITITCSTPPDVVISFRLPSKINYEGSLSLQCTVKIRMVYSRLAQELRIDTSSVEYSSKVANPKSLEKLKTKRIIPLLNDGNVNSEHEQGRTKDWKQEEVEALKRLWETMPEWSKWNG
ncbi:uncharacterized protein L203_103084 [Cryptococcus depauperatus CBS 7841]|uniref:Uncharacterized protein n=1 Tax=Cryptococcus depauperatus CBS 7841 TaxID=1295531 RepID=A0A1E3IPM1_9TREE|nr:hypothetical protein L203_01641 [Cryptococcus depauperatus CBS 7841]